MLKSFFALAIIFTLFSCKEQSKPVRVVMDVYMPGYFRINNEDFGYQYEIFSAYADDMGLDMEIISNNFQTRYSDLLDNSLAEIANVISLPQKSGYISVPVYKTNYVILTRKRGAIKNADINTLLAGKSVLVAQSFVSSSSYDSLPSDADIFPSRRNSFELIEEISDAKYDFLICEKSEAYLGCALARNITQVYEFPEEITVYALFDERNHDLAEGFRSWLAMYRTSEEYDKMQALYLNKGIASHIITKSIREREDGGISSYDDIIKRISESENIDWRFVSAIAYTESLFNEYMISPKGARGLMQIMPSVANDFDIPKEEMMIPDNNILLGIRLLNKLERTFNFREGTDFSNRMSIILAAYNGGIGHVIDARNLARKYGADPDSWDDVSHYLGLKAKPIYANDSVVRSGRFSGSASVISFANVVLKRYDTYCRRIEK